MLGGLLHGLERRRCRPPPTAASDNAAPLPLGQQEALALFRHSDPLRELPVRRSAPCGIPAKRRTAPLRGTGHRRRTRLDAVTTRFINLRIIMNMQPQRAPVQPLLCWRKGVFISAPIGSCWISRRSSVSSACRIGRRPRARCTTACALACTASATCSVSPAW